MKVDLAGAARALLVMVLKLAVITAAAWVLLAAFVLLTYSGGTWG